MKVKFFSDYDTSENLLNRFRNNYDIYDNILGFTVNDDYNFAVLFNRSDEPIKPWAKTITVIQEPSFSEAHQYKTSLTNSDYLIIHDAHLFVEKYQIRLGGKVIESPSYMFYNDQIPYHYFDGSEQIKKQKKLSVIMSGLYFSRGNYRKRIALLERLLASDLDMDIYGRGLDISDPRYKGPLVNKHSGLIPYEYSIAIENSNERNYVSEKFIDCVLCNTTPIYNGAPNIKEIYDERYFRTIDLDSPTIIEDIRNIIREPAPGSLVNKEIYQNKFNLYTKLKEIVFSD